MTFLLAANLGSKTFLAADTLVSRNIGRNIREVVGYYPKLQQYSNAEGKRFVTCLFAGDYKLTCFTVVSLLRGTAVQGML